VVAEAQGKDRGAEVAPADRVEEVAQAALGAGPGLAVASPRAARVRAAREAQRAVRGPRVARLAALWALEASPQAARAQAGRVQEARDQEAHMAEESPGARAARPPTFGWM
jgi:hypothetical protein